MNAAGVELLDGTGAEKRSTIHPTLRIKPVLPTPATAFPIQALGKIVD